MCIRDRLYTRGTVEEYDNMFKMVKALRNKLIITAKEAIVRIQGKIKEPNAKEVASQAR